MKKYKTKLAVLLVCYFAIMPNVFAIVTFQTIANPTELGGRTSGEFGDIFFEGGSNDANLTDFSCCPSGTLGLNTIGSTGFATFYDNFTDFNILGQVYTKATWEVGAGQILFGGNQYTSFMGQAEALAIADGLQPGIETISSVDRSTFNVNPNNTQSFLTFTEDDSYLYTDTSIASFYLLPGQDPNIAFADSSLFDVADFAGEVNQQGLINHFDYLIRDVVDPGWTSLSWSYWVIDAAAKPNTNLNNLLGLGISSFVSYDAAATPIDNSISVPEPSTYVLMGLGFLGLTYSRRKSFKI